MICIETATATYPVWTVIECPSCHNTWQECSWHIEGKAPFDNGCPECGADLVFWDVGGKTPPVPRTKQDGEP